MDKKEILKILKESAINYKENLKDNNLLVIYKDIIKKQDGTTKLKLDINKINNLELFNKINIK